MVFEIAASAIQSVLLSIQIPVGESDFVSRLDILD